MFVNRQKRQALPPEPGSLADITLVGDWTTTGGAERKPFLIHDSGNDEPERMLVFASEAQLRQLAVADVWFMDGTFHTAPLLFKQLYVIRAAVGSSAVSCVYALLTGNQTYITYL